MERGCNFFIQLAVEELLGIECLKMLTHCGCQKFCAEIKMYCTVLCHSECVMADGKCKNREANLLMKKEVVFILPLTGHALFSKNSHNSSRVNRAPKRVELASGAQTSRVRLESNKNALSQRFFIA